MKFFIQRLVKQLILFLTLAFFSACSNSESIPPAPTLSTEQRLELPPDMENGRRLFLTCAICHEDTEGAAHRIGPTLWNVYDHPAARHRDFTYSTAMKNSGIVWNGPMLNAYIAEPAKVVPGGRMVYKGEPDPANRRDLVAYLASLTED